MSAYLTFTKPQVPFPVPQKPGVVVCTDNPRWRQKDQKFKVIVGNTARLKPAIHVSHKTDRFKLFFEGMV